MGVTLFMLANILKGRVPQAIDMDGGIHGTWGTEQMHRGHFPCQWHWGGREIGGGLCEHFDFWPNTNPWEPHLTNATFGERADAVVYKSRYPLRRDVLKGTSMW